MYKRLEKDETSFLSFNLSLFSVIQMVCSCDYMICKLLNVGKFKPCRCYTCLSVMWSCADWKWHWAAVGVCIPDQWNCLFSLHCLFRGLCLCRIEIWIGLSTFSAVCPRRVPLVQLLFVILNNKCWWFPDLVRVAGLWCILILPHGTLYQGPSFIWIKEVEFKNSHCFTWIQIASIYCTEWWNGQ